MEKFLPYCRQSISQKDIDAVVEALKSDYLTTGPKVQEFEEALAEYCGARYAVVCNSGTAALHLASLALDLQKTDLGIVPAITFLASANAIRMTGAEVTFADIDPRTACLSMDSLEETIKSLPTPPKVVVPVHFAGQACDLERLAQLKEKYGFYIVEDACHALGATYTTSDQKTHRVGAATHSEMVAFSFHPAKHITTGEGGAILTNDPKLYERALLYRNHGMSRDPKTWQRKDLGFDPVTGEPNPWYYEMQDIGWNYRLSDFCCALGIEQLKEQHASVQKRQELAQTYRKLFKASSLSEWVRPLDDENGNTNAHHLFVVLIDFEHFGMSRGQVMSELSSLGIGTQVNYIPVCEQGYYQNGRDWKSTLPHSYRYYDQALSLPMYRDLSDEDIARVVNGLEQVLFNRHSN